MKTKLEYMYVLTGLPTQDLQEMFENELWDEQIRQDVLDGKFNKLIEQARQEFALKPEEIMAGTKKVRTRKEWSVLLKEVGVDFD